MDFSNALRNEERKTFTENGATAYNTSSDALVDLFATIGALRERDELEVTRIFADAYAVDPLLATKILFYARDIRGGLGEKKVFKDIIRYCAQYHPEAIIPNLDLIGVYGCYKDLYALVGTPVENEMWKVMKAQFEADLKNLAEGKAVSLLGKWIATPDASSPRTSELGKLTAKKLGYSVYEFKRHLRALRAEIKIVERYMSAKEYDKIDYGKVPSRAMKIYRDAFMRNDEDRYSKYVSNVLQGKDKINASTLYPYDIVEGVLANCRRDRDGKYISSEDPVLEAQWRALPDYVKGDVNALVIADVSGSMCGRPMATSIGLALYFAERNTGAYHNLFMTFSEKPSIVKVKGDTVCQKIANIRSAPWGYNTDLEKAFDMVLKIAVQNHVSPEEMVKSLVIVSDMEIDAACGSSWSFYDKMKDKFRASGYEIPNVVFWNVNSRHDIFHADSDRPGVQLCSGQSPSTFAHLVGSVGFTPYEFMMDVISQERYNAVTVNGYGVSSEHSL